MKNKHSCSLLLIAKLLHNRPQASEDKNVFWAENWRRQQEASQQGSVSPVESLDGEPGVEECRNHLLIGRLSILPLAASGGPAHQGGGATQETWECQHLQDKNRQGSLSVSILS